MKKLLPLLLLPVMMTTAGRLVWYVWGVKNLGE